MAEAFLLSIDDFNNGKLKYFWPYYLPSTSTAASSFLEPAITSILAQLRERPVLESCAGTMVKGSSLKYVPLDSFADKKGIPFTLSSHTAPSYLSLKYPAWATEATSSIGVSQISPREFLTDLHSAITQNPTAFRTRSATWHSQLAETLVKLTIDGELMSVMQDICLIPLHDGSWTSARGQSVFFSKNESSLEIPSGIEVLTVDSSAESDLNRRKFFTSLGVKAWNAPEICRLVLRVHDSSSFDPKSLGVDQLISHAAFLYKASWQPPKTADIWFATMQDKRCRGRKLYIPGGIEKDSPVARTFVQLQKQFAVIHNDYLEAFDLDTNWPSWLVSNLGLSMTPRLITPHVDPKPRPTQTLKIPENASLLEAFDFDKFLEDGTNRTPTPPMVPISSSGPALEDYQMQLMLLEQANKKKLLMARQEQEIPAQTLMSPKVLPQAQQPVNLQQQRRFQQHQLALQQQRMLQQQQQATQESATNVSKPQAKIAGDADLKGNPTPSPPVCDTEMTFALSEEFIFMFRECRSSDVLQLLRDYWHHYSQWIDGVHMKWQDTDFLNSSTQLRTTLGACLVESGKGSLPLSETVLSMIDPQLDKDCYIPTVDIKDAGHPEWALLSYFGVVVKGDIHYYLRCLIAISEENRPDIDSVAYIYEKIQARYKDNEELIRYVSTVLLDFKALTNPARHFLRETLFLFLRSYESRPSQLAG